MRGILVSTLKDSGRVRGMCEYTDFNNNMFQGRLADITMEAWYTLQKEGIRVVNCIHDEFVCEIKQDESDKVIKKVDAVLIDAARQYCPGVKMSVEGVLSHSWTK